MLSEQYTAQDMNNKSFSNDYMDHTFLDFDVKWMVLILGKLLD